MTGAQFAASIDGLTGNAREAAILQAAAAGSVPAFLSKLVPVTMSGGGHTLVLHVAPDVFSIGDDGDYLRTPMLPSTFDAIAAARACLPPTEAISDAIWAAAAVHVKPSELGTVAMTTSKRYVDSNNAINADLMARYGSLRTGALTAGDKKDIVVSPHRKAGNLAIYGWHQLNGTPTQPLSLAAHGSFYVDYSHGARLVARACTVDGASADLADLLRDPAFASLLCAEHDSKGEPLSLRSFTGAIRAGDGGGGGSSSGGGSVSGGGGFIPASVTTTTPASSSSKASRFGKAAAAVGLAAAGVALAAWFGD